MHSFGAFSVLVAYLRRVGRPDLQVIVDDDQNGLYSYHEK